MIISSNSIHITNCLRGATTSTMDNNFLIPLEIYGIKEN